MSDTGNGDRFPQLGRCSRVVEKTEAEEGGKEKIKTY
jgi:hypothetical protein